MTLPRICSGAIIGSRIEGDFGLTIGILLPILCGLEMSGLRCCYLRIITEDEVLVDVS